MPKILFFQTSIFVNVRECLYLLGFMFFAITQNSEKPIQPSLLSHRTILLPVQGLGYKVPRVHGQAPKIVARSFFKNAALEPDMPSLPSLPSRRILFLVLLALCLPLCFGPVGLRAASTDTTDADGDNVVSTIREATRQYEKGDFSEAVSNLNYAVQLILQKKSERMTGLLPDAPPGWKAEDAKSQAVGAEMLGGGIAISRNYGKGQSSVHLEIIAESPMMQSVLMMTSNSVFASASGGKLETVKGNKAVIRYDKGERRGEVYVVVDTRFLVIIKGKRVNRDDLELFANIIDYERLLNN